VTSSSCFAARSQSAEKPSAMAPISKSRGSASAALIERAPTASAIA